MTQVDHEGFVRKELISPAPPPRGGAGAVGWLKNNLFSSWTNLILTILGIAIVWGVFTSVWPWLFHGVWNAGSLKECRSIIEASFGSGVNGACFAVISARWHQFLFGLYPQEEYWRPTLTFFLLLPALAPVMFYNLPRKLLVFSALYPLLTIWLLWGGPVAYLATQLLIILGAVLVFRIVIRTIGVRAAFLLAAVFLIGGEWLAADPLTSVLSSAVPFSIPVVSSDRFGGFMLSVIIGIAAIFGSLPLGVLLALGRISSLPVIRSICILFIEVIRGVPLIALLFTASLLLQYFMPPGTNFDLILRVCILVTLFSAAYIAEIVRGALAAIPKGQMEAAQALGLRFWPAQILIVLPQALKISIPAIVSSFIDLFKDTTLVAFVGLLDPLVGVTTIVRSDMAWKGIYWEPYLFVAAIFFVSCYGMARYADWLERKLKTDHR